MGSAVQQFSDKEIANWGDNDWRGSFMTLFRHFKEDSKANWGYVPNASGGFFGFWWHFRELSVKTYMPYLQLEQEKLCFKIMAEDDSDRRDSREEAFEKLRQTAQQLNMEIQRPDRMGNGKFMTVARWEGDYRVFNFNNGMLDMDATRRNLNKAQELLDAAFNNSPVNS